MSISTPGCRGKPLGLFLASNCRKLLVLSLLAVPAPWLYAEEITGPDYPTDFRNWAHVKTGFVDDQHPLFDAFGGIHHIYANASALQALRGKTEFTDGSMLVFDLITAAPFTGGIAEGERRRIDVMQRNTRKFSSTGGWGYGSFAGSSEQLVDQDVVEKCYGCHEGQKDKSYVFSEYRY
jgi:hypothetical protein